MDLRKPKPIHSVREFLGELLTITTGILIALSLEAAIEHWRTDRMMEYARDDFRTEIAANKTQLTDDIVKMRSSDAGLVQLMADGRAMLGHKPLPAPQVSLTRSFVNLRSAAWAGALSTQVMEHFPHAEERALAEAYSEQEGFNQAEIAAEQQWFSVAGYATDSQDLSELELRQGLHEAAVAHAYLTTLEESETRLVGTYDRALQAMRR